jgi:hypothetical protein
MTEGRTPWTKRDKSIVLGVAVAGALVLAAYVLPPMFIGTTGPGSLHYPLGTAFAAGDPRLGTCPGTVTYASSGCFAGDYVYNLTIFSGTTVFDQVEFEVTNATGSVVWLFSDGGFSIINRTGVVQASSAPSVHLEMTGTWNMYAPWVTGSTPLTPNYDIVIDMGVGDPTGAHLEFVAIGIGGEYTGTTAGLLLP